MSTHHDLHAMNSIAKEAGGPPKLTLKVAEIARMLGRCTKVVYQMIDRGEIPTRPLGRRRAVFVDDFAGWLRGSDKREGHVS
jgi:hypothetical protein